MQHEKNICVSAVLVLAVVACLASRQARSADASAAQSLAQRSGCFKCHAVEKKKDGPALRDTAAMGILLVIHLAVVAGLFITLPYGKFAHVVYRYAALVRSAIEQRRIDAPGH